MRSVCLSELAFLEALFRNIEDRISPPEPARWKDSFHFRYADKTVQHAILMKFARQISGLHAIDVLLLNGLTQEQCVIQRTLDEIAEDIIFLSVAVTSGEVTDLHRRYLEYFWEEEFDNVDIIRSTQKRGTISREKIRSYVSRAYGQPDPSTSDRASRSIYKTFSGYVHSAGPQIMDMCGGDPARFHLSGMRGTPRISELAASAVTYFYRGLLSSNFVSRAFAFDDLATTSYERVCKFEASYSEEIFPVGYKQKSPS